MLHTLKNSRLTVEISETGAELMSVKTPDGNEYLWQGNPEYWAGRASNLFPIVGRLTGGKYTYRGQTYEMGTHGFARKSQFRVEGKHPERIAFILTDTEATRKEYPFGFIYKVAYRLSGSTVSVLYEVENAGGEDLIFAVGGHPGFNVPLTPGLDFEDYYLEFDKECEPTEIVLSDKCFTTEERRAFPLTDRRILRLSHSLFDRDAIVLEKMPSTVTLRSAKDSRAVTVVYPDMPYLGLWHKPQSDAPYVCIEPWTSLPTYEGAEEDLETKRHMLRLRSRGFYRNSFDIKITAAN